MSKHVEQRRVSARGACLARAAAVAVAMGVAPPLWGQGGPTPADIGRWVKVPCEAGLNCNQADPSDWSEIHNGGHLRPEYAALTPDGNALLLWRCYTGKRQYQWSSLTGEFTRHASADSNPVVEVAGCIGLAPMPDGKIVVAGGVCNSIECCPGDPSCGTNAQETETPYVDWVATYDFTADGDRWTQLPSLPNGSWYPTINVLPDGQLLAIGGRTGCCGTADPCGGPYPALDPTVYDPENPQAGWSVWGGTPISHANVFNSNQVNYPRVFILPDDPRLFVFLSTKSFLLDLENEVWEEIDSSYQADRDSAVMYRPGKILRTGGRVSSGSSHVALDNARYIDLTGSNPEQAQWQLLPPMNTERWSHDTIVMPDGKVLVVGGSNENGPVFEAEWIDLSPLDLDPPQPVQWEPLALSDYPRIYHSVALLLPDATVLAAGGNDPGGQWATLNESGDIYEPRYLFVSDDAYADRPIILSAPHTVTYDTEFEILLDDVTPVTATQIAKVSFMGLGAVTHGFDQNQRYVPVPSADISALDDFNLQIKSPAHPNLAPPGYYMLFVISNDGVPSVAKFIRLVLDCPDCPADLTGDGKVGVPDLLELLACWGPVTPPSDCEAADLNGDGNVGVPDLTILLAAWGDCAVCGGEGVSAPVLDCFDLYEPGTPEFEDCIGLAAEQPEDPGAPPAG